MPTSNLTALMLLSAVACSAFAAAPGLPAEPSGQYLKDWLVCGPFPALTEAEPDIEAIRLPGMYTDFLKGPGGEARAKPAAEQVVSFPGGSCTWQRHVSAEDAVDLDAALTKTDRVVGYAYCTVDSPKEQACILAVGSNDGVRAWLNGEPVLDCPGPRGLQMDHNIMPVALRAGPNSLLLKIEERGNRWGFACRFLPLSHDRLAERLRLFDVVSREDGTPVIRARQSPGLVSAVLKSAKFEAASAAAPQTVVWTANWSPADEISIGVDVRHFSHYVLRIQTELVGGAVQDMILPFTAGRRVEHVLFEKGQTSYSISLSR